MGVYTSKLLTVDLFGTQVILVVIFWFWHVLHGDSNGPRLLWIRRANKALSACSCSRTVTVTSGSDTASRAIHSVADHR